MIHIILTIIGILLAIFAAYRIYFRNLFVDVKKYTKLKKEYIDMYEGRVKTFLSEADSKSYRDYVESADFKTIQKNLRIMVCNNGNVSNREYPEIVSPNGIVEKSKVVSDNISDFSDINCFVSAVSMNINKRSLKGLADIKLADLICRNSEFECRFDEGNLIISDNKKLNGYISSMKENLSSKKNESEEEL